MPGAIAYGAHMPATMAPPSKLGPALRRVVLGEVVIGIDSGQTAVIVITVYSNDLPIDPCCHFVHG